MAILRRFPKKTPQNEPKLLKKSTLPMSQKSRHRKWVNDVGDLNTCTENQDIMSKKNVKRVMTPDLMGLAVGGGRFECFVHYSKLQNVYFLPK